MPLPEYQIMVLDCNTGDVVTVYDGASFYELRYSRKLNGIGSVAFTVPGTDENYDHFAWDNFIEIKRTSPINGQLAVEETYLVRSRHAFIENDTEMLVVGGLSLNQLIARRIVDPDDDPTATQGYSVKAGAADSVMRAYAMEQMGSLASAARRTPGLDILPVDGIGIVVDESRRYDSLYTTLREISVRAGIDFMISRTDGISMELLIAPLGSDKTKTSNYPFNQWIGLTPLRSNLSRPSLKIDRTEEQNFVYTLGQGQGEERLVLKIAGDTSYSPFARCEYVKDSRNVDKINTAGLQSAGAASLNKNKINREFSFEPTNMEPGNVYRLDWDVADSVTAIWKQEQFDLRITGVEIEISQEGETVSVMVAELST